MSTTQRMWLVIDRGFGASTSMIRSAHSTLEGAITARDAMRDDAPRLEWPFFVIVEVAVDAECPPQLVDTSERWRVKSSSLDRQSSSPPASAS